MLGVLQRLAPEAARHYHFVVLSDHGQSQGATFRQRHGETLDELVERFCAPDPADAPSVPAERQAVAEPEFPIPPVAPVLVVCSGNLALAYLTRTRERLTKAQIDREYPRLIAGLAEHPGIGVVVVDDGGPVAYGTAGSHRLLDGTVEGVDPLRPYGPHARGDLLRHSETEHVGDLVLISAVDPVTHEVAAFEELVGSHGGLGGWQTDAVLVYPTEWQLTDEPLNGPDAMHRLLAGWLSMLGLRTRPVREAPALEAGEPLRLPDLSRRARA
jgi:hypothetical protein